MLAIPERPSIVLFDVDGTLLDTRDFIVGAYRISCDTHRVPFPGDEFIEQNVGRRLEDVYLDFAPHSLLPILVATHRAYQRGNVELARPYPGVAEVLERLRAERCGLAAVTSRSRITAAPTLQINNLVQYFNVIVAAEDTARLKPHPDPLEFALQGLAHVRPWDHGNTVVVGDSVFDVAAARALGVPCVAVTYGIPGAKVLEAEPDATIGDMRELLPLLGFG
jgi:HAD superfamily hydrolase (TIGR01509 family)